MISDIIISIVYAFVNGIVFILSNLGTVSASNNVSNSIATIKGYYMALDTVFPISVLLAIVAFDLTLEGAILTYKAVRWGYQKIPGVN